MKRKECTLDCSMNDGGFCRIREVFGTEDFKCAVQDEIQNNENRHKND